MRRLFWGVFSRSQVHISDEATSNSSYAIYLFRVAWRARPLAAITGTAWSCSIPGDCNSQTSFISKPSRLQLLRFRSCAFYSSVEFAPNFCRCIMLGEKAVWPRTPFACTQPNAVPNSWLEAKIASSKRCQFRKINDPGKGQHSGDVVDRSQRPVLFCGASADGPYSRVGTC